MLSVSPPASRTCVQACLGDVRRSAVVVACTTSRDSQEALRWPTQSTLNPSVVAERRRTHGIDARNAHTHTHGGKRCPESCRMKPNHHMRMPGGNGDPIPTAAAGAAPHAGWPPSCVCPAVLATCSPPMTSQPTPATPASRGSPPAGSVLGATSAGARPAPRHGADEEIHRPRCEPGSTSGRRGKTPWLCEACLLNEVVADCLRDKERCCITFRTSAGSVISDRRGLREFGSWGTSGNPGITTLADIARK